MSSGGCGWRCEECRSASSTFCCKPGDVRVKLVTWNCRGAFHRKHEAIMSLEPDVLIVQECVSPERLQTTAADFVYSAADWIGQPSAKGLAVFTFGSWTLDRDASWNPDMPMFLPLRVDGGG